MDTQLKIGPLDDLDLTEGMTVRCVESASRYFTEQRIYDVIKGDEGKIGVNDDDGDFMYSTSSEFRIHTVPPEPSGPVVSDGGSSSYYDLPGDATELNDLIEAKDMSFARGNIFKACYRLGEKSGTDILYDINKIIFFAERMKDQIKKDPNVHV